MCDKKHFSLSTGREGYKSIVYFYLNKSLREYLAMSCLRTSLDLLLLIIRLNLDCIIYIYLGIAYRD